MTTMHPSLIGPESAFPADFWGQHGKVVAPSSCHVPMPRGLLLGETETRARTFNEKADNYLPNLRSALFKLCSQSFGWHPGDPSAAVDMLGAPLVLGPPGPLPLDSSSEHDVCSVLCEREQRQAPGAVAGDRPIVQPGSVAAFPAQGKSLAMRSSTLSEEVLLDLSSDSHGDAQLQLAQSLAAAGRGLNGYTTVVIQQIPFKYSQKKLVNEINDDGFAGKYDFLFVPSNARSHGIRGFGFINFLTSSSAEEFYHKYHGQKLKGFEAVAPVSVIPADVQGFEQSARLFCSSWLLRKKKHQKMPIFLKRIPDDCISG